MRLHSNGTNWKTGRMRRTVYVLVFAMLMAIAQGWFAPDRAEASISALNSWSTVTSSNATVSLTTTTAVQSTNAYTVPAGFARMLVVSVGAELSATNGTTVLVTYGTRTMTPAAGNSTTFGSTATRTRAGLFYLNQAELNAASNSNIVVSMRSTAAVSRQTYVVNAIVFEGVDQSGSPITSSQGVNITTASATVGPFGTALTVGTGDRVVELINITRTNNATPATILTWATNWSSDYGPTSSVNGTVSSNYYQAIYAGTASTTSSHTATNTVITSMVAMSIKALPMNLSVGNGTVLGTANAGRDTVNNVIDSFTMAASAGQVVVNALVTRGSASYVTGNISGINVFQDNGTPGAIDGADVLIPSAYVHTGTTATVTFTTPITQTSTTASYLLTVDIAAAATLLSTVTATVINATGSLGTPVYSDTNGATLTIQSPPGLTVANGTNPTAGTAVTSSTDNALDGFTLQTANGTGGTAVVDTLTVLGGTNFTSANISNVKVYKDNGTLGTFDGADVLSPSSATPISGNTTTLTFNPPIYVSSTTPTNYLVTVDITAGATLGAIVNNTVIIRATGHGLATPTINDTLSGQLTIKGTSKITSCAGCHTYPPTDGPRLGTTGAVTGDHGKHGKPAYVCSICHVAPGTTDSTEYSHRTGTIQLQNPFSIVSGTYSLGSSFTQTNTKGTAGNPTGVCTNVGCHGGNSPTPTWGVGTNSNCVTCHNGLVSALAASAVTGGTVTRRDNVRAEFGLAWGHKKTGRSTVNTADCIVCHLEGNYGTQATSTVYHANGYIDLRDPDVQGETRITNISGASYSFVKFSTSYAAGSRYTNGHTRNDVDNILTQNFCLKCHDATGATNTTARSNNGVSAPTATSPFGNGSLGANYTVANGATAGQGLVDVKGSFSTANRSWHPVLGPKNRDFPAAVRMADPYKPTGTRGTSGTLTQGVVLNCFDCHNIVSAAPNGGLTNRTVAAHGNAVTIKGAATVSGTPSVTNDVTFCKVCHLGYVTGAPEHGVAGETAYDDSSGANGGMTIYVNYGCNACHASGYLNPDVGTPSGSQAPRPIRAQDTHGSNALGIVGTLATFDPDAGNNRWTTDPTPVAFIRNRQLLPNHQPRVIGATTWNGSCMGTGGPNPQPPNVCNQGAQGYTVGGTY